MRARRVMLVGQLDPLDASADKSTSRCGVDSVPVLPPIKPLLGCN